MVRFIIILFVFTFFVFTFWFIASSFAFGPLPVDMRSSPFFVTDLEISSATATNSKFSPKIIVDKMTVKGDLLHLAIFE